jgi:hypothetical protein
MRFRAFMSLLVYESDLHVCCVPISVWSIFTSLCICTYAHLCLNLYTKHMKHKYVSHSNWVINARMRMYKGLFFFCWCECMFHILIETFKKCAYAHIKRLVNMFHILLGTKQTCTCCFHKHKKSKKNKYKPLYMRTRAFISQLVCETCLHVAFTNTKKYTYWIYTQQRYFELMHNNDMSQWERDTHKHYDTYTHKHYDTHTHTHRCTWSEWQMT